MLNTYNRKDCLPEETIKTIKKILKINKIKVKESKIININNSIFSVRVELKNIPGVGTNGKGITKKYALASAYAEFMERLQSKSLAKSNFSGKENVFKSFFDENYLNYNDFIKKFTNINNKYIKKLVYNNSKYRYYTSFYDEINKSYVDLPVKIINLLTHSNGLCSGNSRSEALVQGICEIFERYCYKEILFNEYKMPNVLIENKEKLNVYNQLSQLEKLGFCYEIKDCSLNGIFPVIGLVIYDKERKNYLFSIGSDPNFNIALQRCITEIFQGLSDNKIKDKMKPINNNYDINKKLNFKEFILSNWLKCYTSNSGIHPKSFFMNDIKVRLNELPFYDVKYNDSAFKILLNVLKEKNFSLYIKDYSYLGFNTYKVYIPNLSEIDELDELSFELCSKMDKIKQTYFNLYQTCNTQDKEFEDTFFNLSNNIKYNEFISPYDMFNINNYIKSSYTTLNYFYVVLLELVLAKDYNKLIKFIDYKLNNYTLTDYEKEYLSCIKNKINLQSNTNNIYSEDIINDVESLIEAPIDYLKYLKAPSCPNCKHCKCRTRCHYKEWNSLNNLIYQKSISK